MKMIYRVNRIRTAIPAITVVLLMLIVPVSAIAGPVLAEEGSGADTGSGTGTNLDSYLNENLNEENTYYTYRLSVNEGNLKVEKKIGSDWESMNGIKNNNGEINVGSWGFDSATGIGPFNSFYVEMDESGVPKAILNPDNLKERKVLYENGKWKSLEGSIGGSTGNNDKEVDSGNNIMWVLPKVYIGMDGTSLILSNKPFNGGVATAHIIDGKVYPFLALGVYEASEESGKLMSKPGVKPSVSEPPVSKNRYYFQSAAQKTYENGKSMIWNYYQWQLYRMCSFAVMGGFDSQKIVGQGITRQGITSDHPNGMHITGESNGMGPYYGSSNSTVVSKLFLENSWGNVWEFVGDAHLVWETSDRPVIYAGQNSDWGSGNYGSKVVSTKAFLPTSTGSLNIRVDEAISWGLPITSGGVSSKDYFWTNTSNTGDRALLVGGDWYNSSDAGVSALSVNVGVSSPLANVGSRLAYVFGAGAAPDGTTDTGVKWELKNETLTVNEDGGSVNDASDGTAPWYTIIKNAKKVIWKDVTAIGDELQGALPGTTLEIKGTISSISIGALKDYRLVGFTDDNIQNGSSLELKDGILKVGDENAKLIWSNNGTNITISSLGGHPGWLHHSNIDTLTFTGNVWTGGSFSDTVVKKIVANNISTLNGSDVKGITGLTSISVEELTEFGEGTFEGFTSLSEVVGSKITNIGDRAFSGCSSLQTIYLNNLITVGDYALQGTKIGPSLSFSKLTTIGEGAFSGCAQITNVTMDGINKISRFLFQNCSNLSSVVTKDLVSIGEGAFSGCTNLRALGSETTDIDLRFVDTIEKGAFQNCANIVSVRAYVVSEIGQDAFSGCDDLKGFNSGTADTQNAFVPPLTLKAIDTNAFNGVTFERAHFYHEVSCQSTGMKVTGTLYLHDSKVLNGLEKGSIAVTSSTEILIPDDNKSGWASKISYANQTKMTTVQTTQVAFNLAGGFSKIDFYTGPRSVIAGTQVLLPFVKHAGKYHQFSFGVNDGGSWGKDSLALSTGKKSGELLTIYSSEKLKHLVNGSVGGMSGDYDSYLGTLVEKITIELDCGEYTISSGSSFTYENEKYLATVGYGDNLKFPTVTGGFTVRSFMGEKSGSVLYSENGTNVIVGFYETKFTMDVEQMPFTVTLTIHGHSYSVRTVTGSFDLPDREGVLKSSTAWGGFDHWNLVSADGYDTNADLTWYCAGEAVNGIGMNVIANTTYDAQFPLKKSSVTISVNGLDLSKSYEMMGKYGFNVSADGNISFTDQLNKETKVSPNEIAPGYRFIGYVSSVLGLGLVSNNGYLSSGSGLLNDLTISMMVSEMTVDVRYTFKIGNSSVSEDGLTWPNNDKIMQVTTRQLSQGVKIPLPTHGILSLERVTAGDNSNPLEIGSDGTVTVNVTHMTDSKTLILNCVFSNDMTLYIDWGVDGFKVRYGVLGDNGHIIPTMPGGLDDKRTGYELLGFGTPGSGQQNVIIPTNGAILNNVKSKLTENGLIDGNIITIYAVWKPLDVKIELKDRGSNIIKSAQTGSYVPLDAPASNVGHAFAGWALTKDSESNVAGNNLEITPGLLNSFGIYSQDQGWSVVLESRWTALEYTLIFYNTGTDRQIAEFEVSFNVDSEYKYPSLDGSSAVNNMTNTGWKTLEGGNAPAIRYPGAQIKVDTQLAGFADDNNVIRFDTLRVATEYTVKFMNGDSPVGHELQRVKIGDELDLVDHSKFNKAGYTPRGWHWDEDSLEAMTATTLIYEMTAGAEDNTVLLHLIWQQLTYNISYSLDGGTIDDRAPTIVPYGQWIDIPDPSRLGYSFKGWKVTGITSDARYEMFGASQKLEDGKEVGASRFRDLNSTAGGTVTMTAVWNPVEYTVQYDLNGGSGVPPKSEAAQVGKKLSPGNVNSTLAGYEFSGWSLDGVAVIKELEFTSAMAKRADKDGVVTLLAVWTPVQYEIQFRNLDTEKYTSVKAYYGIAAQIGEPERTGYTFMGWTSTDVKGNAMFSPDGTVWYSWPSSGPADGCFLRDLTSGKGAVVHLTASWSANDYRISYNANGGTGEIPKDQNLYKVGDPLKLASTESLKGTNGNRLILGWSMDQTATVPMTLETFVEGMAERANLANAVTLYAVWVEGSYKVTVDVGGSKPSMVPSGWTLGDDGRYWRDADYGTSMKEVMSDWDSVLLELEGHVFTSWSYDVGSVVTDVDVKAEFDEVRQWIIYAFTGIVAFIAIIAFVYTRFERW